MQSRINNQHFTSPRAGWFLTQKENCRFRHSVTLFTQEIEDLDTQPLYINRVWLADSYLLAPHSQVVVYAIFHLRSVAQKKLTLVLSLLGSNQANLKIFVTCR